MIEPKALHREGYVLLRGAIPQPWIAELCDTFNRGIAASNEWPVPRGGGWHYSQVDLDPKMQAVCRLPDVLSNVGALVGERFFLSQVEGREPLHGCGHQGLHRDFSAQRPGDTVHALAFLDDYGPDNGATRLIPRTHRPAQKDAAIDEAEELRAIQINGRAGDILVFDADLVHAGSLNHSGARRRSLLICYFAESLYAQHARTAALRCVRMDTSERFEPA